MSMLFSPISFKGLTLRNRIVMPPMATAFEGPGGSQKDDGVPGEATIAHYEQRSKHGVGMIIVEHTYISRQGKAHRGQLGIDRDEVIPEFKALASAIKKGGAVAVLQINHVGAAGNSSVTGQEPLGPSDIPVPNQERKPKPMGIHDIAATVEDFARAAERVRKAGFQAVEIHSAHSYLLTQFLSPLTNKRNDVYGGSLENRARFLLEVVEAVKARTGGDFPVLVRLGSVDGIEGGIVPEDAAKVAFMLQKAGLSVIDVSGAFAGSRPKDAAPGYFVPPASTIKKKVDIPVLVTGGITDPLLAENILREGKADLIGIGRALLRDPEWVLKAKDTMTHQK